MSDQKCPECGQSIDAASKTVVLNHILAWDPDPWYKFLKADPGKTFDIPNLGQVMLAAACDPEDYNFNDGYDFQGEEPPCWVVLSVAGKGLYRKSGKTDSYCNEYQWTGPFVEVVPNMEVKMSWTR